MTEKPVPCALNRERIVMFIAMVLGSVLLIYSQSSAQAQVPFEGFEIDPGHDPLAPSVGFSGDPVTGPAPLQVQFTDESTGSPTGWAWYFGDEDFIAPWVQAPTSPWAQRSAHTSVVLPDGSIVIMGGYTGSDYLNDVWRSTDKGLTWTEMTSAAEWTARYYATSVVLTDGSIVLMGGFGGNSFKNDVWRSSDKGATWTQMTASAEWSARTHHTSVALPDGSIVLMGGVLGSAYNDVWRSTNQGTNWTQMIANAEWSAREGHASVVLHDGSILLLGGYSDGMRKSDVWRSDNQGETWTAIQQYSSWAPRTGHSCILMPDGSLVLSGGSTYSSPTITYRNDVWRSNDHGDNWNRLTDDAEWSGRSGHATAALLDGSIVLTGGFRSGNRLKDVWRLETAGSYQQNPSHVYSNPGGYQVALQAYNEEGAHSIRRPGYIHVDPDTFWIHLPLVVKNTP